MKRIITMVAVAVATLFISSCATAGVITRNDVHISYEQISTDASFKQFKKATKANQIEILNFLVSRANEEYLKCETIDDLYSVKEQLDIIKFYNNNAKQKSISVTNAIRKLDTQITQAEADYKKEVVIEGTRDYYRDHGQE
jgi:hypothetical protein